MVKTLRVQAKANAEGGDGGGRCVGRPRRSCDLRLPVEQEFALSLLLLLGVNWIKKLRKIKKEKPAWTSNVPPWMRFDLTNIKLG